MNWWAVVEAFLGDTAAGALVLYVGYRFVDSKLNLREREQRQIDVEAERAANRTHVLTAAVGELHSNMAQHLRVTKSLEKKEGVPFPLFDVSMWTVLSQAAVFTTLKPETVEALIHAYNRMVTANEQNKFLADMTYGSTGLLATASFAGRMADPQVKLVHDQYQQSLDDNNDALLGRLADLKTHLEAAIDSVEKEVGIYEIPASTREFVGEGEHAELHVVGETPALKPSDQR